MAWAARPSAWGELGFAQASIAASIAARASARIGVVAAWSRYVRCFICARYVPIAT
jgi:hypothetical protein